ncbi:MAG: chitobiase/beta-hexosaminidase C-terminal domain-containing protein [Treponema sp.]|jgi:hypothetical protein|nr:chitobiase/beta-hexosaminidase C-terminal domain-containing protein [Treponema sp.]
MHKNHGFLIGCAAVFLAAIITLTGCPAEEENIEPSPSAPAATLRYETVPYRVASSRAALDLSTLITSAYDDYNYYYVFLLGHINRVPLEYRPAIFYDGIIDQTIGYTRDEASTESVEESLETATENSVSSNTSYNWGVELGLNIGNDATFVQASITASTGGEYGWGESTARSTANTLSTVKSVTRGASDSWSVTIGNGAPPGLYRYSLFGTTDVYYVVITDKRKNVTKSYLSYCARTQTYWGIDYEPDIGGNFGKTIPGELLEIPTFTPSALPTPTSNNVQPLPPERAATPTASKRSGTYESENAIINVDLSGSGNSTIYYTTNGADPATSETSVTTRYKGQPIPLEGPGNRTLKAIATDGYKTESFIMTETYTIVLPPVQAEWTITSNSQGASRNRTITDSATWVTEVWNVKNATTFKEFEPAKLLERGYTDFEIYFGFDAQEDDDGWVHAEFKKGNNGAVWWGMYDGQYDLPGGKNPPWQRVSVTFEKPIGEFDSSGNFTLLWRASGSHSDDWNLGYTEVRIKAITK